MISFINVKNQDFINASKATLTVIITFLLVYSFANMLAIYFSLYTAACCAFMQAGSTRKAQFISMLLAGSAFIFFLAFGLAVKSHLLVAYGALLVFAFATFYLPNLGLTYKIPPVLGPIFYVFVISMPTEPSAFLPTIAASTIGVIVSIAIYFLFWPYEVKHELMLVSQTICHQYRTILERFYLLLRRSTNASRRADQIHQINETLRDITQALGVYEKLNDTAVSFKKEEADYFDSIYLRLYAFLQILKMMRECFPAHISEEAAPILQPLYRVAILELKHIEYRFDKLVPHSFIAKNLIGRSLNLGKTLTLPLLRVQKQPKKPQLTETEFNALLEKLIALPGEQTKLEQLAFALLRARELLTYVLKRQENIGFDLKEGVFL